jgi:hypothetical protein
MNGNRSLEGSCLILLTLAEQTKTYWKTLVAHQKYTAPRTRGAVDVKWLVPVLDFILLWQTALQCVLRTIAYRGIRPRIATKKKMVPQIAIFEGLNLRADCQGVIPAVANSGTFESDLSRGYSCCDKPRNSWEPFAKGLFLLWQTAVLEHSLPQQTEIKYRYRYQPVYCISTSWQV